MGEQRPGHPGALPPGPITSADYERHIAAIEAHYAAAPLPEQPQPDGQVDAWKRALATARIGWIIDDEGKLWPPHDGHADVHPDAAAFHPHKYDGGCAICRAGDRPEALDALLHFLAAAALPVRERGDDEGLRAENERLRAALTDIANDEDNAPGWLRRTAIDALAAAAAPGTREPA